MTTSLPPVDVRFAVGQTTRLPFYSRMLDPAGETLFLGGRFATEPCWQVPLAGGTPAIVPAYPAGPAAQPWIFANPDTLPTGIHTAGRADAPPVTRIVLAHSDCYAYTNDVRVIEFTGTAPSFDQNFPGPIGTPPPAAREYALPTLRAAPGAMLTLCAAPFVQIDANQASAILILADAQRTVYVRRYALCAPVPNAAWPQYWQAQLAMQWGGRGDPNPVGDFDWKLYRLAALQFGTWQINDPVAIFKV